MMDTQKNTGSFVVKNDKGLHARPSTELVKCASRFASSITLKYQQTSVNAKSLLGILMLAAPKGAKIALEAVGSDAEQAIQAIEELAQIGFHIHY